MKIIKKILFTTALFIASILEWTIENWEKYTLLPYAALLGAVLISSGMIIGIAYIIYTLLY